jgi:hypothetical protein
MNKKPKIIEIGGVSFLGIPEKEGCEGCIGCSEDDLCDVLHNHCEHPTSRIFIRVPTPKSKSNKTRRKHK